MILPENLSITKPAGLGTRNSLEILIIVHSSTYLVELLRVARILNCSPTYSPNMFFGYPYPTMARDIERCLSEGLTCIDHTGHHIRSSAERATAAEKRRDWRQYASKVFSRLPLFTQRMVRNLATKLYYNFLSSFMYFRQRIQFVRKLMLKFNPEVIILAGDNVGYDTSVYIKVAHESGIPAIIVPSTMSNGLEAAEIYYNDPNRIVKRFLNRLVAKLYPNWVRKHKGRRLLAEPPGRILAMEWLGLAPPLPWIFNSGYADAIVAESEAMRTYYREGGLPEEQIYMSGSLANDELAANLSNARPLKNKLYRELNLPCERPMILTALPPDFLYLPGGRTQCDFQKYDDLESFWIQALSAVEGWNVVICLHPSVNHAEKKYLEQWGAKIAAKPTTDLIPLCDLYVASVSSTIRWAVACGKPVINYDVYRYEYTDYLGLKGVIATEERDEFLSILNKMTSDRDYFMASAASQQADAEKWGCLDGLAGERLLDLMDQQIRRYGRHPAVPADHPMERGSV